MTIQADIQPGKFSKCSTCKRETSRLSQTRVITAKGVVLTLCEACFRMRQSGRGDNG